MKNHILSFLGFVLRNRVIGAPFRILLSSFHLKRSFPFFKRTSGKSLIILFYHRVLPENDPFAIDTISILEFENHLKVLARHFNVLNLSDAVIMLKEGTLPPNAVCITFDDGYKDNYDFAFPLLEKYNMPATIFLASDYINTERLLWHDQILQAFKNSRIKDFHYPAARVKAVLTDKKAKIKTAYTVLEWLKQFNKYEQENHIRKIVDILDFNHNNYRMMLNWQEIKQMSRNEISFGAHTKHHQILSKLDNEQLLEEIIESKESIEDELGGPVNTFAYPNGKFGDYDNRAIDILSNAGITCSVTTNYGVATKFSNPLELPRSISWERDKNRFYLRLVFDGFLMSNDEKNKHA
jgi:peptidoglycan/xylan/chitin deacetylase (PgdA/CDA1 family)